MLTSTNTCINGRIFIRYAYINLVFNGSKSLPGKVRKAIESNTLTNFVSIASIWEIAVKVSLGKLELTTPFKNLYSQINYNGFRLLPVTFEDTLVVSGLPFHHRDPFDRILIAQTIANDLTIITADTSMSLYEVRILW